LTSHKNAPYWKTKPLQRMNVEEWEALCDGCGICCLYKLEDEDTGEIFYTNVACRLLDPATCQCTDYPRRSERMPTCVQLNPGMLSEIHWLPRTCAYRRALQGEDLQTWHPLISGVAESVHLAGISIRGRMLPETDEKLNHLEEYIIDWIEF